MLVAARDWVASPLPVQQVRLSRRAPRIDVLMRVQGQLVPVGAQVLILNLSRTGFAVVSRLAFAPGATLDFRLVAETGVSARVTAEAVHTRPRPGVPGEHVTGFKFVPGRMTGIIPLSSIDKLIDAVTPAGHLLGLPVAAS